SGWCRTAPPLTSPRRVADLHGSRGDQHRRLTPLEGSPIDPSDRAGATQSPTGVTGMGPRPVALIGAPRASRSRTTGIGRKRKVGFRALGSGKRTLTAIED